MDQPCNSSQVIVPYEEYEALLAARATAEQYEAKLMFMIGLINDRLKQSDKTSINASAEEIALALIKLFNHNAHVLSLCVQEAEEAKQETQRITESVKAYCVRIRSVGFHGGPRSLNKFRAKKQHEIKKMRGQNKKLRAALKSLLLDNQGETK